MGTCGIPEVNSCCHFISLRTGAKICGYIALVGSLMLLTTSVFQIVQLLHINIDGDEFKSIVVTLGIDVALQLAHAVASYCLLYGAYQGRRGLAAPWLVTAPLSALAEVLFTPALFHRMFVLSDADHPMFSLQWFILTSLLLVDDVYGWLVVFSYYRAVSTGESSV